MKSISLAVVGVTGVVGRKFLDILAERQIPIHQLVVFASAKSAGKSIAFKGQMYPVIELTEANLSQYQFDYALFSAGSDVALKYAPLFAQKKTIVIDNSSAFRMDPKVPLVIPEVNPEDAFRHQFIIANPNCSTIQAVVAIKPLHDLYRVKRMVISTYQAVSGAGLSGTTDLKEQLPTGKTTKFPYQIYQNLIPQIDVFMPSGNTKEEEKIINETRKIMHLPDLKISSTAVRVPVPNCHSESINLEFEKPLQMEQIFQTLGKAPGVVLYDDVKNLKYPMPLVVDNQDAVYVGRIRKDASLESGINLFVVGDNLRKGAATNAVQILELFLQSSPQKISKK